MPATQEERLRLRRMAREDSANLNPRRALHYFGTIVKHHSDVGVALTQKWDELGTALRALEDGCNPTGMVLDWGEKTVAVVFSIAIPNPIETAKVTSAIAAWAKDGDLSPEVEYLGNLLGGRIPLPSRSEEIYWELAYRLAATHPDEPHVEVYAAAAPWTATIESALIRAYVYKDQAEWSPWRLEWIGISFAGQGHPQMFLVAIGNPDWVSPAVVASKVEEHMMGIGVEASVWYLGTIRAGRVVPQ